MCNIAYFQGSTEQILTGDQVNAIKFPIQFTYDWFSGPGILQMHMPSSAGFGFRLGGQLKEPPTDLTELKFGNSFSVWNNGTVYNLEAGGEHANLECNNLQVNGTLTQTSDKRLKADVSPVDPALLLDFCNSLSPSMYSRTDLTPQPRLGLIAQDVEQSLLDHSLPQNPFINKFDRAIDGETQELLGLDYARLSVCLLGAVKELTTRITQLESQLQ